MSTPDYHTLVAHYADCFDRFGATPKGVDWPKPEDARLRQEVMLGVMRGPGSLLDLGCGYGALLDVVLEKGLPVDYRGIDLAPAMIAEAKKRHPEVAFETRDILLAPLPDMSVDYIVMNGVFTEKRELSFEQMEAFFHGLTHAAFAACRVGIAFNVMSAHVDWQREDLFHLPFDRFMAFAKRELSRHVVLRGDYGLWEYTGYVYR